LPPKKLLCAAHRSGGWLMPGDHGLPDILCSAMSNAQTKKAHRGWCAFRETDRTIGGVCLCSNSHKRWWFEVHTGTL